MGNAKRKLPSPEMLTTPPGIKLPEMIIDKSITIAAAKAALTKEKQDRLNACKQELQKILDKYNCQLIAVPFFTNDGRIVAQAQIASNS